jgi:hypothetical protein
VNFAKAGKIENKKREDASGGRGVGDMPRYN